MLIRIAKTIAAVVCAVVLLMPVYAGAATFKVTGGLVSATFPAPFNPANLSDVNFSFEVRVDDLSSDFVGFNVQLSSFSGVTINGTPFDISETDAAVINDVTDNRLAVFVGTAPAAFLSRNTNDFRFNFELSGSTLRDALETALTVPLVGADLTNAGIPDIGASTSQEGMATVTMVHAPIPLPAPACLLLAGVVSLAWVGRRRVSALG